MSLHYICLEQPDVNNLIFGYLKLEEIENLSCVDRRFQKELWTQIQSIQGYSKDSLTILSKYLPKVKEIIYTSNSLGSQTHAPMIFLDDKQLFNLKQLTFSHISSLLLLIGSSILLQRLVIRCCDFSYINFQASNLVYLSLWNVPSDFVSNIFGCLLVLNRKTKLETLEIRSVKYLNKDLLDLILCTSPLHKLKLLYTQLISKEKKEDCNLLDDGEIKDEGTLILYTEYLQYLEIDLQNAYSCLKLSHSKKLRHLNVIIDTCKDVQFQDQENFMFPVLQRLGTTGIIKLLIRSKKVQCMPKLQTLIIHEREEGEEEKQEEEEGEEEKRSFEINEFMLPCLTKLQVNFETGQFHIINHKDIKHISIYSIDEIHLVNLSSLTHFCSYSTFYLLVLENLPKLNRLCLTSMLNPLMNHLSTIEVSPQFDWSPIQDLALPVFLFPHTICSPHNVTKILTATKQLQRLQLYMNYKVWSTLEPQILSLSSLEILALSHLEESSLCTLANLPKLKSVYIWGVLSTQETILKLECLPSLCFVEIRFPIISELHLHLNLSETRILRIQFEDTPSLTNIFTSHPQRILLQNQKNTSQIIELIDIEDNFTKRSERQYQLK